MSVDLRELDQTVAQLLTPGKGILAADESLGTMKKRFAQYGITDSHDMRRAYRELLFTAPQVNEYISGVILYEETLRDGAMHDKVHFPKMLQKRGIVPGIKVDLGTVDLPFFPGEKTTQGLDGLPERLAEYKKIGAKFTKWRVVISIGHWMPTRALIDANVYSLARYAADAIQAGLVPILEPEVLMEGRHSMERCEHITAHLLEALFNELKKYRIPNSVILLKTHMILPGTESGETASTEEIAEATLRVLHKHVPPDVPGIVFLSGGQEAVEATERLNAITQKAKTEGAPWTLTFSYSRALEAPVLETWKGDSLKNEEAQAMFLHRSKMNAAAAKGTYNPLQEI